MGNKYQSKEYTRDSRYKKMRGRFCESLVVHMLLKKNYEILEKNYYTIDGEVDIIISKGRFVIFVEVKSWVTYSDDALEYIISKRKLHRLKLCAEHYLQLAKEHMSTHTRMCVRFDVILIDMLRQKMVHYKGV